MRMKVRRVIGRLVDLAAERVRKSGLRRGVVSKGCQGHTLISTLAACSLTTNNDRIRGNKGKWTHEEHEAFLHGLDVYGRNWEGVAAVVPTRTVLQIRTHSQK